MRTLKFGVNSQELARAPDCDFNNIMAGTSGYLQVAFEFDREWDGAVKVAAFYPHPQLDEVAVLITDGVCAVPEQVASYTMFKVGVVGQKANGQRITTNLITVRQERGSGQFWQQ